MAIRVNDLGPLEVSNPFAGVDFSQLERSLQRPRTLMNFAANVIVAGMTILALIPLFSVLWMLLWRGGQKLSLALFTQLPPAPLEAAVVSAMPSSARC